MEKLQIVLGVVAILVFVYLSIDFKDSGKDIPPNIQLLLSVIFGAIMTRGVLSLESAKAAKEKLLGEKKDKKEVTEDDAKPSGDAKDKSS